MKITFLGTAAAELYPGAWCECDYCTYARQHGGRNIRFNSAIHFAEKCLVDFPPHAMHRALEYNLDLLRTELMLCTHSHEDHFFPRMLYWRYRIDGVDRMEEEERKMAGCARITDLPLMRMFGNRKVMERMTPYLLERELADYSMDYTVVSAYQEYHHAGVDFIPMIASHMDRDGVNGLIYLIHAQGKTFLYATDSNTYIDRTRDCMRAHKVDAVIMECTFGDADRDGGHISYNRMLKEVQFFQDSNMFTGEPQVYLTHMSPHRTPPYDILCERLKGTCIQSAYDGMILEL